MASEGTEMQPQNQEDQHLLQPQSIIGSGENHQENTNAIMSDEALKEMSKYLEGRAQTVRKNAYESQNIYFLFLGALLTAVAQLSSSSSPKCHLIFYFIPLAVLPLLLNIIPLCAMAGEYVTLMKEHDKCALEQEVRRDRGRNIEGLRLQPDAYREMMHKFRLGIGLIALIVLNVFLIVAFHAMLCGDDKDVSADSGCAKVCEICATHH